MWCILLVALPVLTLGAEEAGRVPDIKRRRMPGVSPHINDGTVAKANQFPYMAALTMTNNGIGRCGGSLIDEEWVLTAAHCVDGYEPEHLTVRLGSTNYSAGGQLFRVSKIIMHEQFNKTNVNHDLAVIKLTPAFKPGSSKNIKTIKLLPRSKSCNAKLESFIVSGWGKTHDSEDTTDALLWAKAVETPMSNCYANFLEENLPNTVMCVIGNKAQPLQSACQGDSGGPLVTEGTTPFQAGIVSFGNQYCSIGKPVTFTRVSLYLDWLTLKTGQKF